VSAAAIALVLASAFVHASWNHLVHSGHDRAAVVAIAYTSGGIVLLPFTVFAPPSGVGWVIALSIVFQSAYQLLMVSSYDRGQLSVTYPVARGVSPLLVVIGGLILLDERPDATTVTGIVVLTAGLLGLAAIAAGSAELRAAVLAVATGLAITGYTITDARAVRDVDPVGYFALVALAAGVVGLIVGRVDRHRMRASLRAGTMVGALQMLAYVLVLFALERAQAGQVASLRQVSVVIGVLLAREAVLRRALAASLLVALGAVLVAW
jgi:drug/metabolite transporter (DMT)-like permease